MIHREALEHSGRPSSGQIIDTPTGRFYIGTDDQGRIRSGWIQLEPELNQIECRKDSNWLSLACRLQAYFDGGPWDFDDIPTPEGSDFHVACWEALRRVPPGQLVSYGRLAELAGRPGTARAVGSAMRNNPLPIIVPCHRVISASGIGGFSGSTAHDGQAIKIKLMLIRLERANALADQPVDEIDMLLAATPTTMWGRAETGIH